MTTLKRFTIRRLRAARWDGEVARPRLWQVVGSCILLSSRTMLERITQVSTWRGVLISSRELADLFDAAHKRTAVCDVEVPVAWMVVACDDDCLRTEVGPTAFGLDLHRIAVEEL